MTEPPSDPAGGAQVMWIFYAVGGLGLLYCIGLYVMIRITRKGPHANDDEER